MKRFMTSFFSNPYDIHVYGKIPDFINTALYLADINVQKLILKDPVVDGLSELYPISSNIELGINRVDRDHTIISFNGCIPFHICYSITDYLNRNNNYPVLIPRKENDTYSLIDIDIYTKYWMKKVDENKIKSILMNNIQKCIVKEINTTYPFTGYVNYYGLFTAINSDENDIKVYSIDCPVNRYLYDIYNDKLTRYNITKKWSSRTTYELSGNIPYYTSRYLIDKIKGKNILDSFV